MTKSLWCLLLLFLALASNALAVSSLTLEVGKSYIYQYRAKIHAFGGTSETNPNEDDPSSTKGEHLYINIQHVALTPTHVWKKENGKKVYLMNVKMRNATMTMAFDDPKKDAQNPYGGQEVSLDAELAADMAFTLSSNGKIYKVYAPNAKKEKPWATAMKKNIISQLQCKLTPPVNSKVVDRAGEKDTLAGQVNAHYKQKQLDNGELLIRRDVTDRDLNAETKNERPDMKLESHGGVVIGQSGQVAVASKQEHVILGVHTPNPNIRFFRDRFVPFEEGEKAKTHHNDWMNIEHDSSLTLTRIVSAENPKYKTKALSDADELIQSHPVVVLSENENEVFVESDLAVGSEAFAHLHEARKQSLEKDLLSEGETLTHALHKLAKDPENLLLLGKISELVSLKGDNSIAEIYEAFIKALHAKPSEEDRAKHFHYLQGLQNLLLAVRSEKGQRAFVSTWRNSELADAGVMRTLRIKDEPISAAILEALNHFATNVTLNPNDALRNKETARGLNAYLVRAAIAKKLTKDQAKPIIKEIIQRIRNHKKLSNEEIMVLVHAMGNAGKNFPVKNIQEFLLTPDLDNGIKVSAIEALSDRADESEDDHEMLSDLLNTIVLDKKADENIRAAAIAVQGHREMQRGSIKSLDAFLEVINDKTTPELVRQAVARYIIKHYGADELIAAITKKIIALPQNGTLSDAEFLGNIGKAIGDGFNKVGNAIKDGANKVVEGVKKVGDAIGDGVNKITNFAEDIKKAFGAAGFDGNKVCIRTDRSGSKQVCLYHQALLSFVHELNPGAMTSSAHFEYEKRVGINKAFLYGGVVGLAATNFNCRNPPSSFGFSIGGKVYAELGLFGRNYELLEARAHIMLTPGQNNLNSRALIRVAGSTVYDVAIIPEAFSACASKDRNLYKKDLFSWNYNVQAFIGPIPVVLGARASAKTHVDAVASACLSNLNAAAGIRPVIEVEVAGNAALGVTAIRAGIEVGGSFNYGLYPNLNVKGLNCAVCAGVNQYIRPITVTIRGFGEFLKWRKDFDIFKFQSAAVNSPLGERCWSLPQAR